jgi:predicted dinucleotide-binding enzyme
MEIGTIGAGPFAQAFAKRALKAGHRVKLSNRRGLESLRVPGELLRGPLSPLDPLSPCECELSLTFGTQDHTW